MEVNNSVCLFDDNESPRAVDSSGATWHNQGSGFGDAGEGRGAAILDVAKCGGAGCVVGKGILVYARTWQSE